MDWKCVFSTATDRGTGCNREPHDGEFARDILPSECASFDVEPSQYTWDGSKLVEVDAATLLAEKLAGDKVIMWEENRRLCRDHILNKYPDTVQRNAALGVYGQEYTDSLASFIGRCIAEENRVFDLIEAVTTTEELAAIPEISFPAE